MLSAGRSSANCELPMLTPGGMGCNRQDHKSLEHQSQVHMGCFGSCVDRTGKFKSVRVPIQSIQEVWPQQNPFDCTNPLEKSTPRQAAWWCETRCPPRRMSEVNTPLMKEAEGVLRMDESHRNHRLHAHLGDGHMQPQNMAFDTKFNLLWCMVALPNEDIAPNIAKNFRNGELVHLDTVNFTRWLFKQHRGCNVRPSSLLVAGFREAKPCMAALWATYSGDTSALRPDGRRAMLSPPLGGWFDEMGEPPRIAVAALVVVLDSPARQAGRTMTWLTSTKDLVPGLVIYVVDSMEQLGQTLEALAGGQQENRVQALCVGVTHGCHPQVQRIRLSF